MQEFEPNRLEPIVGTTGTEQVCYFLGAGFSKDSVYKLPVTEGFLSHECSIFCCDALNTKAVAPLAKHPKLRDLLAGLEARYGPLKDLNLEAVMTDLHVRTAGIGRPWTVRDPAELPSLACLPGMHERPIDLSSEQGDDSTTDFSKDYALLLDYICLRLRVIEVQSKPCEKTQCLVRSLRRRDSILTLNYDTVVENHLNREHDGRTFPDERVGLLDYWIGPPGSGYSGTPAPLFDWFQPVRRGYLAKLHGSVDWRSCSNSECPNYRYIQSVHRTKNEAFEGAEVINCTACGSVLEIVIIPPVATKSFVRFPKINLMWLQAYRALRLAHRWVFMGVSFAATDMHLRSLLRAASENWICREPPLRGAFQICVANRDMKDSTKGANELLTCLAPEIADELKTRPGALSTFETISDYLDRVKTVDGDRAPNPEF